MTKENAKDALVILEKIERLLEVAGYSETKVIVYSLLQAQGRLWTGIS